jgi:hypothetical protein
MWPKGVLTSKKLGTLIDSELLIYCLQADHILSHISIVKTLFLLRFTLLLLSTMYMISPSLVALLYTVVTTAHLLVMLLYSVVATPQPLDTLLWFVYVSLQPIVNQLSSLQSGVNQLLSEISGSHSKFHLPLAPHSLSVCACLNNLLFHCLSNESLWYLFDACLIMDLP